MLRRRPALRAGRRPWPLRPEGAERPKHLSPFSRFLIANGIRYRELLGKRKCTGGLGEVAFAVEGFQRSGGELQSD
jgi:hypothetical protein